MRTAQNFFPGLAGLRGPLFPLLSLHYSSPLSSAPPPHLYILLKQQATKVPDGNKPHLTNPFPPGSVGSGVLGKHDQLMI